MLQAELDAMLEGGRGQRSVVQLSLHDEEGSAQDDEESEAQQLPQTRNSNVIRSASCGASNSRSSWLLPKISDVCKRRRLLICTMSSAWFWCKAACPVVMNNLFVISEMWLCYLIKNKRMICVDRICKKSHDDVSLLWWTLCCDEQSVHVDPMLYFAAELNCRH